MCEKTDPIKELKKQNEELAASLEQCMRLLYNIQKVEVENSFYFHLYIYFHFSTSRTGRTLNLAFGKKRPCPLLCTARCLQSPKGNCFLWGFSTYKSLVC